MHDELQRELEQLGFTERQACVYITLLRFGKSGAQQLALATGVPRASCYDTLEQLTHQGLVRSLVEDGQQIFVTEPPERIGLMLALQLEEVQTRRRKAENFLPQLSALAGDSAVHERSRVIGDRDEINAIHKESHSTDREILQLFGEVIFKELNCLQRLSKHSRTILVVESPITLDLPSEVQLRQLPPISLETVGEMSVCGDRVLFFNYTTELSAIEIISPVVAATCRTTLELAWQQAGTIVNKLEL